MRAAAFLAIALLSPAARGQEAGEAPPPVEGPARVEAKVEAARRTVEQLERETERDDLRLAAALTRLAAALHDVRRDEEAEACYRRAAALYEQILGARHRDTAQSLCNLASFLWDSRRIAEAEALYIRALEIREEVLGPDDLETARVLRYLAALRRDAGRYAEAETLYRRALEIREKVLGPEHPATAELANSLALQLRELGRYAEAEPLYQRALEVRETRLGPYHLDTLATLNNLAVLRKDQGRFAEAESLFLQVLERTERLANGAERLSMTLSNLARLYEEQGRYDEEDVLLRRALAIREGLGLEDAGTAACLTALANLLRYEGRVDDALALGRRALAIVEARAGPEHPATATALDLLANLLAVQGSLEEAEERARQALAIYEARMGARHPDTAAALGHLSRILQKRGALKEALPLQRRALEILEEQLGDGHPRTAAERFALADALLRWKRPAEAEPLIRAALVVRAERLGEAHPVTVATLHALGVALDEQGRHAEALDVFQRLCDAFQQRLVTELVGAPAERRYAAAAEQWHNLDHLLQTWRGLEKPSLDTDEVYRRCCAWKGVVLRNVIRLRSALAEEGAGDSQLDALRRRLVEVDGMLSRLAYAEGIQDPGQHQERMQSLRFERRELERDLLLELPIDPARETTSGRELARLLPERTAVLDFVLPGVTATGSALDGRVLCFVTAAGSDGVALVDLGPAAPLERAVSAYLDWLAPALRGEPVAMAPEDRGAELAQRLLEPLRAAVPADATRWVVIPEHFLAELPFGALPLGDGHYLLEAVDVVYASDPVTLRDQLAGGPRAEEGPPSVLAIGGVDYGARGARDVFANEGAIAKRGAADLGFDRRNAPLPGTAKEVAALAAQAEAIFGAAAEVRLLTGRDATEEALRVHAGGRAVLHLATHGFFERAGLWSRWQAALARASAVDEAPGLGAFLSAGARAARVPDSAVVNATKELGEVDAGLLAGLVLAGANLPPSPGREDGVLTAAELAHLDLSACRLAVLSACRSALGTGRAGEGLRSMRRAFHEAGARTVVATLWRIDDEVAQRLMHTFYEGLWQRGLGPGDALRRARLELLRDPRTRDPAHWAAFTLSGEWR